MSRDSTWRWVETRETVEGLVVCLSRLNRILGIYTESRYAVVQPGVTNLELQDALAQLGQGLPD